MNKKPASALLTIMFILTTISALLIRIQYRASLLLETVIEREQHAQWYYATQALMRYAILFATYNWSTIHELATYNALMFENIDWPVTHEKRGRGTIGFTSSGDRLYTYVQLHDDNQLQQCISCILIPAGAISKEGLIVQQAIIDSWTEHNTKG